MKPRKPAVMASADSSQTIFLSGPEGLARILSLDEPGTVLWEPEEMKAIWHHQLSVPIESDLSPTPSARAAEPKSSTERRASCVLSYGGLLADPHPPMALLKLTKDFAKQTLQDSDDRQLKEVATALYYASYAAGLTRCGQVPGTLPRAELRRGFKWALEQSWVDEKTRALFQEALAGFERV